ncbi:MAG: M42 family metallopeptidase [Candidatus Nanohaloarchaea archaeon]
MEELLGNLVEATGAPGHEEGVREALRSRLKADKVREDNFGNLVAEKGSGDRTLMLIAHMDSIGLSVRRIDEEGFLRVSRLGGIYSMAAINQRFNVHASEGEELSGVAGHEPVHVQESDEKQQLPELEELFIDIGADSREEALDMGVRKGDFVTYDAEPRKLGNGYFSAPGIDDRAGCAAVLEAFNSFEGDFRLVAVFSAQEEVGRKGAKTSSFSVDPDVALAVDTCMAGDVPNVDVRDTEDATGDGVGIVMSQSGGRGLLTPKSVREWLLETAEQNGHSYFRSLYDGGATDAATVNVSRSGVPAGSLGIPTRYVHSPVETVKISDVEEAEEFLESAFESFSDFF